MTVFKSTLVATLALTFGAPAFAQIATQQPGSGTDVILHGAPPPAPPVPVQQPQAQPQPQAQQPAVQPPPVFQLQQPQMQVQQPAPGNILSPGADLQQPFPHADVTARCPPQDAHCVNQTLARLGQTRSLQLQLGGALGSDAVASPGDGTRGDIRASFRIVRVQAAGVYVNAGDVGIYSPDMNTVRIRVALANGRWFPSDFPARLGLEAHLLNGFWNVSVPQGVRPTMTVGVAEVGIVLDLLRSGRILEGNRPGRLLLSGTVGYTFARTLGAAVGQSHPQHYVPFGVRLHGVRRFVMPAIGVLAAAPAEVYGSLGANFGPATVDSARGSSTAVGASFVFEGGINFFFPPVDADSQARHGVGLDWMAYYATHDGLVTDPRAAYLAQSAPGPHGAITIGVHYVFEGNLIP